MTVYLEVSFSDVRRLDPETSDIRIDGLQADQRGLLIGSVKHFPRHRSALRSCNYQHIEATVPHWIPTTEKLE